MFNFVLDQVGQEVGLPVLLAQPLQIHGSQAQGLSASPSAGKSILIRALLAVDDALFLHIEGHHRNLPILRLAVMLRRIDTSADVSMGRSVAECEFWGAKLTSTLTFSGLVGGTRSTGGSSLNCS